MEAGRREVPDLNCRFIINYAYLRLLPLAWGLYFRTGVSIPTNLKQ